MLHKEHLCKISLQYDNCKGKNSMQKHRKRRKPPNWSKNAVKIKFISFKILKFLLKQHETWWEYSLKYPHWTAAVAQWLRRCAAEDKDAGSIPASVAAFRMEAKSEKRKRPCVWRFRRMLKIPRWSELIRTPPRTPRSSGVASAH